jgi:hypothetical protein
VARLDYQFTVDGRTWTLDYQSILMDEWVALERVTGQHWAALAAAVDAKSAAGIMAFYWLARRREKPGLGYSSPEMKIRTSELTFEVFTDEATEGEQGEDPSGSGTSPMRTSGPSTSSASPAPR